MVNIFAVMTPYEYDSFIQLTLSKPSYMIHAVAMELLILTNQAVKCKCLVYKNNVQLHGMIAILTLSVSCFTIQLLDVYFCLEHT